MDYILILVSAILVNNFVFYIDMNQFKILNDNLRNIEKLNFIS